MSDQTSIREKESSPAEKQSPSKFEELQDGEQLSLVQEFWLFIVENKKWWMIPILVVISMVGLFVALASTGAAPFIYTLF